MGEMFDDEVFVFTPQGEVKALPAGATPLDFAYAVHTDVGHRCVGAKVNGRIVPLHSELGSGDIVEILTSKPRARPVPRLAEAGAHLARPQQDPPVVRAPAARGSRAEGPRLARPGLPLERPAAPEAARPRRCSPQMIREMGFKKADDFYVAIGGGKVPVGQVVNKVLQRLKTTEVGRGAVARHAPAHAARVGSSSQYGVVVDGTTDPDVLVRMAKCCTPVPGDPITGYISVGRGITIHRDDCPNVRALMRTPERFCPVELGRRGEPVVPRRDRGRRPGTGRACSRTSGGRSPRTAATSSSTAASRRIRWRKNWYVVEVGDVERAEEPCSRRCATSSRCSTPTASRRARARSTDACPILECDDLRKTFAGGFEAVRGITFDIEEGEAFGLLGPNGAGKTTTMRMLGTLLTPSGGRATRGGPRRRARGGRGAPGDRLRDAGGGARALRHRARAPAHDGPPLRALARAVAGARRRAADPVRARGGRRSAGAHVLGRHAQAHRPGLRARAPPAPAVPRRADDRRRSDLARGALGRAAPAAGRGRLAVPDDALPRGGRPPVRPPRDRRSRRDRRPRHAGRAQGRGRRRRRDRRRWTRARRSAQPRCWRRSAACASRAAGAASRSS